jgi:hypothetical protein
MISEDTAPGTKVVCVEAAVPDRFGPTPLRTGEVYTVDAMWRTRDGAICVRLRETAAWHVVHDASFLRARFRLDEPARATVATLLSAHVRRRLAGVVGGALALVALAWLWR